MVGSASSPGEPSRPPRGPAEPDALPAWRRLAFLLAAPVLLLGPGLLPGLLAGRSPAPPPAFPPVLPPVLHPGTARPGVEADPGTWAVAAEVGRQVRRGVLPTWSPRLGLGLPFAAAERAAPAWPPAWLHGLLPPRSASALAALLALVVGGAGVRRLCASRGMAPGAAAIGLLVHQTSAFAATSLAAASPVGDARIAAGALLPWALVLADGTAAGRRLAGPALTLVTGLAFLAGSVPAAAVAAAVTALLSCARAPERRLAGAGRVLLHLALGVGAAGVVLLPRAEAAARAALPGGPGGASELLSPFAGPGFAGVAVLLLAATAVVATPRRALAPALVLAAVWAALLGWPALRPLVELLDSLAGAQGGSSALRVAEATLVPWLAALAVQGVLERHARAWPALAVAAFGATASALLASSDLGPARELLAAVPGGGRSVLAAGAATLSAALAAALLRRAPGAFQRGAPRWKLGCALVVVAALFAGPLVTARPAALLPPTVLALALVLAATPGRSRPAERAVVWMPLLLVVALEGATRAGAELARGAAEGAGVARLGPEPTAAIAEAAGDGRVLRLAGPDRLAEPSNALVARGLADLVPDVGFPPAELAAVHEALARAGPALLAHPALDLARVTAVVSPTPVEHPRLVEVLRAEGTHVYRRAGAPNAVHLVRRAIATLEEGAAAALVAEGVLDPRAEVALPPGVEPGDGGGRGEVVARRPSPACIDAAVRDGSGGWLVVHEGFAPGWKAAVDGRDAEVVRANGALLAVRVPPGDAIVRLKYEPWSLRIGAAASLVSLVLAALLARRGGR